MTVHEQLNNRRLELGMTFDAVSRRSGVPIATVKRTLNRGAERAAFGTVAAIASALGMSVDLCAATNGFQYCRQQAQRRAHQIVSLVQGTSALEAQAVSTADLDRMVEKTVHEIMSGPNRRLWT
jgi:hypothetical protein